MKIITHSNQSATARRGLLGIFALLMTLIPASAFASEANVVLKWSQSDQVYLGISLAFGIIAIVVGFVLRSAVLAMSPGNEKMQEVGLAIREGALAYLKRQVGTMIWFVAVLAVLLGLLFTGQFADPMKGAITAISFIAGVAASYIAGYVGMILAVEANMRTANAALTSYAKALQVAFRAGAVAGLVTVGMGLIGATVILYLGGADAMKYLIGFGFGGSLAALFMRVGGGIFTKAADVGADLVGKVEAGIPEDDPRNPAVIADNVGDNVGDCAGMAADIFESYEVTLVAAIVLGAATAAIFDQATWMKLVLFALMARGVGIIASIIGIMSVKGSDDINTDPLKFIRKGFSLSALIAAAATFGLAYYLMGGMGDSKILTTQFVSADQATRKQSEAVKTAHSKLVKALAVETKKVVKPWMVTAQDMLAYWTAVNVRAKLATDQKKAVTAVSADDVLKSERMKKIVTDQKITATDAKKLVERAFAIEFPNFDFDEASAMVTLNMGVQPEPEVTTKPVAYAGYTPVDYADKTSPVAKYSVTPTATNPSETPAPKAFLDEYAPGGKFKDLKVFKLKLKPLNAPPNQPELAAPRDLYYGPAMEEDLDKQIKAAEQFAKVDKLGTFPVKLFINGDGKLLLGVESKGVYLSTYKPKPEEPKVPEIDSPSKLVGAAPVTYFMEDVATMKSVEEKRKANPTTIVGAPQANNIPTALVERREVEWWRFALAIAFGIGMAFAIEMLTDYYVSTHKKPVQEVAGVATAGPAPMIINGFALAQESSVFSVVAIVVALIMPLQLFPHELYGGYILSFYGIALVGLGLLTTTGYILAMDTFGPISDNAQGVFEMSGAGHNNEAGSKAVQRLDAAGNTTKALTKGFAIATAVVAAVALFHSFIESAKLTGVGLPLDVPAIFLGMLVGGAAPFLFSAFSINAVGRAAFELINEVRRQFREDPGIMKGTSKPNYAACVSIVTRAAQTELIGPGVLAIFLPLAVAFGFSIGAPEVKIGDGTYVLQGAQALGGFLAGAILSGQLLAVLLANAGGIWDNAKKVIEDGMHGGKGTEAHKAGVVCDTVGDPFKDTAGPALNPLIKVMNLVALLLAPVVITPYGPTITISVFVICMIALGFSIWWSKRSSMQTAMQAAGGEAAALSTDTASSRRITVEDDTPDKVE